MTGRLSTGDAFPDFSRFQGLVVSGQLPADPRLIVFYRGHWCAYCRKQLVGLAGELTAFQQLGVSVIAISSDNEQGKSAMERLTGVTFPIVADRKAALIRHLDLIDPLELRDVPVALPAAFLVDRAGIVRYHYVGQAPEDRPRTELLLLGAENLARRKC